ncbi:GcrA family cell cycle regulator [Bradyrhizobium sp. HKCCYLS2038]|uniref:GcrA family cell cycle regulator n=1 Tax=unclassified Bradyrhizobium TaxID=2631580 RepID=UPI003EB8B866
MQSTDWPERHSLMLRELHAKGLSYAEIARALNTEFGTAYTRNATLGRGKRLGLAAPGGLKAARGPDLRPAPAFMGSGRRRRVRDQKEPDGRRIPVSAPELPAPVRLRCVGISPRLLSLDQLEPGDCRYPYGGDRDDDPITFCGHPRRPGSSYCSPHFQLTRNPDVIADRPMRPLTLRLVAAA